MNFTTSYFVCHPKLTRIYPFVKTKATQNFFLFPIYNIERALEIFCWNLITTKHVSRSPDTSWTQSNYPKPARLLPSKLQGAKRQEGQKNKRIIGTPIKWECVSVFVSSSNSIFYFDTHNLLLGESVGQHITAKQGLCIVYMTLITLECSCLYYFICLFYSFSDIYTTFF